MAEPRKSDSQPWTLYSKVYEFKEGGKSMKEPRLFVKAEIPGGLAAGKKPSDFPREALKQGTKVELEHTRDQRVAQEIAMDHLTEDQKYYQKLKTIEQKKALGGVMKGKKAGDASEFRRMTYGGGRISAHKRERRAIHAKYPTLGKALDLLDEMMEKAQYPTSAIVSQAGKQPYGTAKQAPGGKETKEALAGVGVGKETGKVMGEMKEMKEAKQGKETTAALREIGVGGKSTQKSTKAIPIHIPTATTVKAVDKATPVPIPAIKAVPLGEQVPTTKFGQPLYIREQDRPKKPANPKHKEGLEKDPAVERHFSTKKALEVETKYERTAKALTAAFMPRLSRAHEAALRMQRSATDAMTRGNSRFAKDIHTGPLTGEVIEDLEEDAAARTHRPAMVYKSCTTCGRTYMAKSQDAECPTCSVNKSYLCSCGMAMIKSAGGYQRCPLCNP